MKGTITTTVATPSQRVGPEGADYELYGVWDGASIDLQILSMNGDWEALATFTEDDLNNTIKSYNIRDYRFKASVVGADTDIKFAINR